MTVIMALKSQTMLDYSKIRTNHVPEVSVMRDEFTLYLLTWLK